MKIAFSEDKIDNFGGLISFNRFLQQLNFGRIVASSLGSRAPQAKYSYADVLSSHTYMALSGGEFTEDINRLKKKLPSGLFNHLCSTDTFQEVLKQLSNSQVDYLLETERGKEHDFCFPIALNKLLTTIGKRALPAQADKQQLRFLDHDHTKVFTQKADAKACYKGHGYYSSWFSSENIPLYVSGQGGNSVPASGLKTVVETGLAHLVQYAIAKEMIFRADGACYVEQILPVVLRYCKGFLIRSKSCPARAQKLKEYGHLKTLNRVDYFVYDYKDTLGDQVVRRILYIRADEVSDDLFPYRGYSEIITSLKDQEAIDLIDMYNQRGTSEQLFSEVKQDFNLAHPPFSDLQYNTAYFVVCALSCVLVKMFKDWIVGYCPGFISRTVRIKKLIFQLIAIPGKVVRHARKVYYKLYVRDRELRLVLSKIT